MQRSWFGGLRAIVLAVGLAAGAVSGANAAPTVSIESAVPGSNAAGPAVVFIRDLPVPTAGATITVNAQAHGLAAPAKLSTLFVVGGGKQTGTRKRSFRAIIDAPQSVLATLANDPHATITVTIAPKGHPEAVKTCGPFAVTFAHLPSNG